jgi:hypothetical protein
VRVAPVASALAALVLGAHAFAACPSESRFVLREHCADSANRAAYRRCVLREVRTMGRECRADAERCELRLSTAARPHAAICCLRSPRGVPRVRIVHKAQLCRPRHKGESACLADGSFPSGCDACAPAGGCSTPPPAERWLFTGVRREFQCPFLCPDPMPIVTGLFAITPDQIDEQTRSFSWSYSASFSVGMTPCHKGESLQATDVRDGRAIGRLSFAQECGFLGTLSWSALGRLTKLTGGCGDGTLAPGEGCELIPDTCGAGNRCDPTCQCVPADLPTCGDGVWSLFEPCDGSAIPSGCTAPARCRHCVDCSSPSGAFLEPRR